MKVKKMSEKKHYVDNEKFFNAMVEWKNEYKEAIDAGDPKPAVSEYIGDCFLKISEKLSHRPNFANYPYRDEMVSDGIENCLMYAHNFDPEKSKNPFSYFTQMIYYAFLRRIEKEKKQSYIKFKMMEENDDGTFSKWFKENYFEKDASKKEDVAEFFSLSKKDLEGFGKTKKKKTKDANSNNK
tara:strand:- start:666 stop:1214 length:549 start_codon:yes stop_codon:yes gene_type:complete